MAKMKNPNRVKAGKKAWAKMKRAGTGLAAGGKKKRRSGTTSKLKGSTGGSRKPKLLSLSKLAIVGGVAAIVTSIGEKAAESLLGWLNVWSDDVGLGMAVTGSGLITVTVGLKALGSIIPWFGRKYRAFLRGYGLRP